MNEFKIDPRILESDFNGLYSADLISSGKIRGIYKHNNINYAITGLIMANKGYCKVHAIKLVPLVLWNEEIYTYSDKVLITTRCEQFSYKGIKVSYMKDNYIMSNVEVCFMKGEYNRINDKTTQMNLFN